MLCYFYINQYTICSLEHIIVHKHISVNIKVNKKYNLDDTEPSTEPATRGALNKWHRSGVDAPVKYTRKRATLHSKMSKNADGELYKDIQEEKSNSLLEFRSLNLYKSVRSRL